MAKASGLLLEYRQEGRTTWAIRFYQNGLVKEFSDFETVFENDQILTRSRPLAWRELARLSSPELEKLLAALRKANFFSLPERIGGQERVKDGTLYSWTVNLDGQKKKVLASGPEASASSALTLLGKAIQELTADAFERVSAGKGSDA